MTDTYREAARCRLGRSPDAPTASAEFRRRAVELARLREKPIAKIAEDLGISESCLRNWMVQADVDDGRREGLTSDERAELVQLRREKRVLEMEVEILKRASAYFAGRTSSQNDLHLHRRALRRSAGRAVLPGDEGVPLGVLRLAARSRRTRPRGCSPTPSSAS